MTLLVGDPGQGKSTLMLDRAARLSRGQLEGDLKGEPVTVLVATAEDTIAHVVRPRLQGAGADLARVKTVGVRRDGVTGGLVFPDDLVALRARMLTEGARLLIVDPLVAHLSGELNSHRDQDVRRAIAPLARLAEEADFAVVGIVHLNKATVSNVLARVSGSVAFVAAARSLLLLGPDPEDRDGLTRILAHAKSNLGMLAPALRLRVEMRQVHVEHEAKPIDTSAIAWEGEAPGVRAEDLVSGDTAEEQDAVAEAKEVLRVILAKGPVAAKDVQKELRENDIAERAWRKAKKALVKLDKSGFHGGWVWSLRPPKEKESPKEDKKPPQEDSAPNTSAFGEKPADSTKKLSGYTEGGRRAEDGQRQGKPAPSSLRSDDLVSVAKDPFGATVVEREPGEEG